MIRSLLLPSPFRPLAALRRHVRVAVAGLVLLGSTAAARASEAELADLPEAEIPASETQKLLEGDDIRIAFPAVPSLDTVQKIRADGKISMSLVGEVQAAGLTPLELQKVLAELYKSELVSNEVTVTIVASTFPVYVSGAVLHPGEVRCDRPTTVLEAIMKAGGFDTQRAKLEKVIVIRRGEKNREVNIRAVLQGKAPDDFFLKPSDKIMVMDKALWF